MKFLRIFAVSFIVLFFFSNEILGISERFLYTISFFIFFYQLIQILKNFVLVELDSRSLQLKLFYKNLVNIRRVQTKKLLSFYSYVKDQDIEHNFFLTLNNFISQLTFSYYLNLELVEFVSSQYDISEIDQILLVNHSFAELEENAVEYFVNN